MNAAADSTAAFPWATIMAAGFGLLRLSTRDFWAMTPREICSAFGPPPRDAGPSRPVLELMMQQFPDGPTMNKEQE
ncbi:phage tail assembly chaperone [Phyllobacterium sp. P30BS-XVII]|uniref:phage tail assembly chaperone n=1 Tax=Phyllobacterium sp. P30BS-XVII TaxID=2587046 RepID=UPI000DD6DAB4|nr:phage tail assembly chaperone [Phyllobacterium sp. P30BS-XVII]